MIIVTLGFGAIGWVDDWRKVVNKDPEGMRSREKYFGSRSLAWRRAPPCVQHCRKLERACSELLWMGAVGFFGCCRPRPGCAVFKVSYPLGVLGFVILTTW